MKKTVVLLLAAALLTGCGTGTASSVPQTSSAASVTASSAESAVSTLASAPAAVGKTDDEIILAYEQTVKQSFKGLEVYCWTENNAVYCGVLPGTNRNKTTADFTPLYAAPATPAQMAKLLSSLDKDETYVFVLPVNAGETAAVETVKTELDKLGLRNLSAPSTLTAETKTVKVSVSTATTEDWDAYDINDEETVAVSIALPETWKLDSPESTTITNTRSGVKIVEFLAVVTLKEGQKPFDKEIGEAEGEVLSQTDFTAGANKGVCRIVKISPSGGNVTLWYPHTYVVTQGDKAIGVTFYSLDNSEADRALFLEAVKTVKLS